MENRCGNPYSRGSSFWLKGTFIMTHSIPVKGIGLSSMIAMLLAFAPAANAFDVEISGHLDRMIRGADNDATGNGGQGSDVQHLDNGSDQSRLRLTGSQNADAVNGGVAFDLELRISDTSECYDIKDSVGASGPGGVNGCGSDVEWSRADAIYDANWGRISLGKGDSATRGSDRADLSKTDLILNYDNRRNTALDFFNTRLNLRSLKKLAGISAARSISCSFVRLGLRQS